MPDVRSFNIEAFKAKFGDGARQHLFYFQPQWPTALNTDVTQEDSIYLVKTTSLPATTLEEITLNWQGFQWKFPGRHTYSTLETTFNVDLKAKIRMTFEKWSYLAHDPKTNFYNTHDVFMMDQRLNMVGYQGQNILEVTLHDAWPSVVGAITLDYGTTDVASFSVTWTYSWHELKYSETGGLQTTAG